MDYSKENYNFLGFQGGPTFSRKGTLLPPHPQLWIPHDRQVQYLLYQYAWENETEYKGFTENSDTKKDILMRQGRHMIANGIM